MSSDAVLVERIHIESAVDVRAVVLTGAGRGFCAGVDLKVNADLDRASDRFRHVGAPAVSGPIEETGRGLR